MATFDHKVLITGANGFIGHMLCREAQKRNFDVIGATRCRSHLPDRVKNIVVGDIDGGTDWRIALSECDVVIHLAARVHVMIEQAVDSLAEFRKVNVVGTANLAKQAADAGVKRFVYVSSIGVNGLFTFSGNSFSENDVPNPHDAYALSKWEAEQVLRDIAQETGLEVVIVRPPLVYGGNAPGNFLKLMTLVAKGIPLPLANLDNKRSLIYVQNLVDALLLCAVHPAAAANTYLVSDGQDVSTSDLLSKLSLMMGKKPRLFSCPRILLRFAGKLLGKSDQIERLLGSLQVNSNKIRQELGWKAPYTLDDGLAATIKNKVL